MTDQKLTASPFWRGIRKSPTADIGPYCVIHESVVGDRAIVKERVSLKRCVVGEDAELNAGSYFEEVTIEADVQVGPNCSIVGVWHSYSAEKVSKDPTVKRIRLKKGCLLGAGVIVVPGVTIGEGAVIGAGTLVTKDVPARTLCYGPPHAQVRRQLGS